MNISRSLQTVTLALVVIGILLLALGGYLSPLSRLALSPLVGAQTWLFTRYMAVRDYLTAPREVTLLVQQNANLESQVADLQAQIIELQQENADLQVLSSLLDFAQAHPENEYLTSAVIGRDPSPFLYYVVINQGSDASLRRGMPVVTAQGLVGRVAAVTANASRVQLITDPGSAINVRLNPSGAEGLLVGSLTGQLELQAIPQEAEVNVGDLVLTSGLGGNYPPDILIGQVTGVRKRPVDLFQTASVQPVVDFSKLKIVMVIVNFQPIDLTPLIPPSSGG